MTRPEHRAKCIEAMADAMSKAWFESAFGWKVIATAALDALHGIAYVNPIETDEMKLQPIDISRIRTIGDFYELMSAARDLTNRPEGKP